MPQTSRSGGGGGGGGGGEGGGKEGWGYKLTDALKYMGLGLKAPSFPPRFSKTFNIDVCCGLSDRPG